MDNVDRIVDLIVCGALLAPLASGQLAFEGRQDHGATGGVSSVVVGDVDGDGAPDAITFGNPTLLFRNLGDGSFARALDLGIGGAFDSRLTHLDGDGQLDLVRSTGTGVFVHMGHGDGTFDAAVEIYNSLDNDVRMFEVGDLTGDGFVDVVATSGDVLAGEMVVTLVPGNGDGSFGAPLLIQGPYFNYYPIDVEIGDLDEDGFPDLVLVMNTLFDSILRVYLGTGSGAPVLSHSIGLGVDRGGDMLLVDPNGDGHLDLVIGGGFGVGSFPGLGDGTFGTPSLWDDRVPLDRLVMADFDGDGVDDLAHRALVEWDVVVLAGSADGSFAEAFDMTSLDAVVDLATADFDLDGRPDLAFGAYAFNDLFTVLRNHSYAPGDPWADLGHALEADNPNDNYGPAKPILVGDGSLVAGEPMGVTLWRNRCVANNGFLILGLGGLLAPFKGGTFVPTPDIVVGPFPNMSVTAPMEFAGVMPAGLPSGAQFWVQAWFSHASAPLIAATTGLRATVP